MNKPLASFSAVLAEAIKDLVEHGFSPDLVDKWQIRLRQAVMLTSPLGPLQKTAQEHLQSIFRREVERGGLMKYHLGVSKQSVDRLTSAMRMELDRRILASADLIKLNRDQAIEKTLQRFAGWASSIPMGGSRAVDKVEVKDNIGKSVKQAKYEQRRVAIDQGHKLISNINAVVAEQSGAIAMMWRSHWKQPGYNYREDHKDRDRKVYAIRGNWALQKGLVNHADGYADDITAPAQEPFCRCFGVYLYNLRDLPAEMLTEKGRQILEQTRVR